MQALRPLSLLIVLTTQLARGKLSHLNGPPESCCLLFTCTTPAAARPLPPHTVNNVSQVVHGAHCPNNNLNLRITTESVTAVLQMRKGMCLISVPDSCVQNQANIVKT